MNPVSIAALTGALGTAIGSAPDLIPSDIERSQKAELKRLQRQAEMGALGLTEQEKAALEAQMAGTVGQAAQQAKQERERLLAGSGAALGGQQAALAVAAEGQRQEAQSKLAQEMQALDMQKQAMQTERIRELEGATAETKQRRMAAVAGILGAAGEGAMTEKAQQALIQRAKEPTPQEIAATMQMYNVSEDVARGLIDKQVTDPVGYEYFLKIQAAKAGK
jgi:hypothetical protein